MCVAEAVVLMIKPGLVNTPEGQDQAGGAGWEGTTLFWTQATMLLTLYY